MPSFIIAIQIGAAVALTGSCQRPSGTATEPSPILSSTLADRVEAKPPAQPPLEISVDALKWRWIFFYGEAEVGITLQDTVLHVPANRPVRLKLRSLDVPHKLSVPRLKVYADAIPDQQTEVQFTAAVPGTYPLHCDEYCGAGHADMKTEVVVHEPGGYEAYLDSVRARVPSGAELGRYLYENLGCMACHTIDGSAKPGGGPSYKGFYGTKQRMLDGSEVVIDEAYLRESIRAPRAKTRAGYSPIMPSLELPDGQIDALVAFIVSLNR